MEFSNPVEHIASLLTDNGYDRNDGNNAWFELSGQQQQDVVSTLLVLWPFRKQQAQPGESPEHTIDNHSRRVGKKSMQQRPMQQPASWCGQEQHTVATHANKSGLRSPMLTQAAGVPHQQAQPGENPEHTNNTQPRGAGKNSIRSGDSRIHESGITCNRITSSIDYTSTQQRPMQQPALWCGQEQHTVATHANKSGLRSPMLTQAAGVPHQQAQPGENPEHTNNTQPRGAGKNSIRSGDSRIHESGIARTSISGSIDRTSIGNGVNASTVAEDNPRTGLDLSTVADDDPATISSKEQEQ